MDAVAFALPSAQRTDLQHLLPTCHRHEGEWRARFAGLELYSAFQPIVSPAHQRVVGYEALLRARTVEGVSVPPLEVFAAAERNGEVVQLDRLARLLHVANFVRQAEPGQWLLLNVNPRVAVEGTRNGAFFADLLAHFELAPETVVIEILEGAIGDEARLSDAVNYYRRLGCLVALDDFGSGHSNFSRVLQVAPEIIKLDRRIVAEAADNPLARRLLPNMVSLLHEAGCLVLAEGIETRDEALLALDADLDFLQGYLFGRPETPLQRDEDCAEHLSRLNMLCHVGTERHSLLQQQRLAGPRKAFEACARAFAEGVPFAAAFEPLTRIAQVNRCYLLDGQGLQVGDNLLPPGHRTAEDPRFAPLYETRGASWNRRAYFRQAVAEPNRVQVTRPYLSLAGAHLCVTLSMAIARSDGWHVACCDLVWLP